MAVHKDDFKNRQTILCRTVRKYGEESFVISKIDSADTWEEVCELEKYYIELFNTKVPYGMNMTDGGDGTYGLIMNEETRKQMSKTHTGMHEGSKNHMYGKISSLRGKQRPKEFGEKVSKATKGRIPWNKGKVGVQVAWNKGKTGIYSEATLEKMRNKNWKWSDELRERMKIVRKGCQSGEKHSQCKLTKAKVKRIREFFSVGIKQYEIADMFGVTSSNIHCIVNRISWAHVA